jgi:predicted nucleic acid-binding protein
MTAVLYDAGPLIAADRNDRRLWAEHRARLELGIAPLVPAPVVAQASRSPKQAQLRRLLRGCEVVPLDEALAHRAGALLGKTRTTDIADASLVALAAAHLPADIVTSDPDDIARLLAAARVRVRIVAT